MQRPSPNPHADVSRRGRGLKFGLESSSIFIFCVALVRLCMCRQVRTLACVCVGKSELSLLVDVILSNLMCLPIYIHILNWVAV